MAEAVTTWPAAAVIGAVVSLVVVAINVVSSRIARREDREEKRREWLREKQVRDIEEIIPALGRFVEEIAERAGDIDATQSIMNDHLRWELKGRAEHADDEAWIATGMVETAYLLYESGKNLHDGSVKMNDLAFSRESWFDYGTRRLTLWLATREETRGELDMIGEELQDFCLKVLRIAGVMSSLYHRMSHKDGELTEEDIQESDELRAQLEAVLATRGQLEDRVIALQEKLADRLKTDVLPTPAPANGGPVVWLARRIEASVHWFLS